MEVRERRKDRRARSPAARPELPGSLADVVEVQLVTPPERPREALPEILIEVPHGATRRIHFEATRDRLVGALPDDLEQFFYVNTDVGSIECARWVARMVTSPASHGELEELAEPGEGAGWGRAGVAGVLIVRGLVARTFVDCNRVIDGGPTGSLRDGLTPALPDYVTRAEDVATLTRMHGAYQAAAAKAYEAVCGAGGTGLILHTYAPRSVRIDRVDGGIVAALRRAYEPATWARWERRPDVDLITHSVDGEQLAPRALARALRRLYDRFGVEVAENATYRLHAATMGHVHSVRYPGRVLCLEINRGMLADPFTPFEEMSISEAKARRLAAPIAAALLRSRPGSG